MKHKIMVCSVWFFITACVIVYLVYVIPVERVNDVKDYLSSTAMITLYSFICKLILVNALLFGTVTCMLFLASRALSVNNR